MKEALRILFMALNDTSVVITSNKRDREEFQRQADLCGARVNEGLRTAESIETALDAMGISEPVIRAVQKGEATIEQAAAVAARSKGSQSTATLDELFPRQESK